MLAANLYDQIEKEILEINPVFTKFILDLQLSYKPEPYKEGDRYLKQKVDADLMEDFYYKKKVFLYLFLTLFWLTRCNASLPYFYMPKHDHNTLFLNNYSICDRATIKLGVKDDREANAL